MAESWYTVVDDELDSIRKVMDTEVTSAYPELNDMCEAALSSRYSKTRAALSILAYYANGGSNAQDAVYTASCFEAVYNGLHLHDQVDEQGNVKVVKKKLFSKEPSTTKIIVAGDFMFIVGFRIAYVRLPDIVPYLMKVSSSISDAIFDIVNNSHNSDITEAQTLDIIRRKSAIEYSVLFECAAMKAGAGSDVVSKMAECGSYLGSAIQTMNDLDDILGSGKKPRMDTLLSGFPTLPLFYAMQDPKIGPRVKEVFADSKLTPKAAAAVIALIRTTDVRNRCLEYVETNKEKAISILNDLPDSKYKTALIDFIREV